MSDTVEWNYEGFQDRVASAVDAYDGAEVGERLADIARRGGCTAFNLRVHVHGERPDQAIAAGLQKVTEESQYQRLLISRPIFPLGRDIGYATACNTGGAIAGALVGGFGLLPLLTAPGEARHDWWALTQIARQAKDLIERARARKLLPEEYQGATFSVSNLGMFGIEEFSAVINPPEAAILAVGTIRIEPVVEGDAIVPGRRMRFTMSCDHRVIDGATGAKFMAAFKQVVENPLSMLL